MHYILDFSKGGEKILNGQTGNKQVARGLLEYIRAVNDKLDGHKVDLFFLAFAQMSVAAQKQKRPIEFYIDEQTEIGYIFLNCTEYSVFDTNGEFSKPELMYILKNMDSVTLKAHEGMLRIEVMAKLLPANADS